LISIYATTKLNNQKTECGLTGLQKISGITASIGSFAWDGSEQSPANFDQINGRKNIFAVGPTCNLKP